MQQDGEAGAPGIEVETRGGTAVIRPFGDLDRGTAPLFRRALWAALARDPLPTDVVVDLQHLDFCDSAGLNALLEARTAAADVRRALYLAAPRDQVLRLLELTGTTRLFLIEPAPPF